MSKRKPKGKLVTGMDLMHNPDLVDEKWFMELRDFLYCFLMEGKPALMIIKCKDEMVEAIVPCWARSYKKVICVKLEDYWGGIKLWTSAKRWASRFSREHKGVCYTTVEEVIKACLYLAWRGSVEVNDSVNINDYV